MMRHGIFFTVVHNCFGITTTPSSLDLEWPGQIAQVKSLQILEIKDKNWFREPNRLALTY